MKQVLRHNLMQDPEVFEIVQERIYTAQSRDEEEATRIQPVAIIEFRIGRAFAASPIQRRQAFVYGYSNRSQDEALRLYEAIARVLRRKGIKGPVRDGSDCFETCVYGIESSGVLEGRNNNISAWFARGTWSFWGIG